MISAAEARDLANTNIAQLQLEQIERAIKESIIMGGTRIYYKTEALNAITIEYLRNLGYKIQSHLVGGWDTDDTEISWEA